MDPKQLPVWEVHGQILDAVRNGNRLVVIAPTGSGKTTQIPQMLLDAGLAGTKKVVVLQPRRVAARSVAARVAHERQCTLGAEVGYQIRFDDQTGLGTRLCFVTEGILLRWLQDSPSLPEIGVLIFDEFHERNLLSDVALALTRQIQSTSRPDLKCIVMSATLDAGPVAEYLGGCPIVTSQGQTHPVEVRYLASQTDQPLPEQAAETVSDIVNSGEEGDVLVFMPGMGEILATVNAIRSERIQEPLNLIPLHGDLAPEDQDRAFLPSSSRKVIIATNVAETSITIDGIRHVVDAGLARIARYDAERGLGTLAIEEISRASADQRKGRAGRTAPGTCHRLWTESGHLNRPEKNTPEIQRADLAEVVLLLHSLGIRRAATFDWLDKPDPQSVERAEELLCSLGALQPVTDQGGGGLTPVGRQMLRLPMHPRFSRMLVEAARRNCVVPAALCAALVSGRDLLVRLGRDDKHISQAREVFEGSQLSDFYTLMRAFQFARQERFSIEACKRHGIHAQTARQIEQTWQQILEIARRERLVASLDQAPTGSGTEASPKSPPAEDPLLRCLVTGFIDQLAQRRDTGSLECLVVNGRAGTLQRESVVQNSPLLVAGSLREVETARSGKLTLLGLATAVQKTWLAEMFPEFITVRKEHLYDRTHKRVAAVRIERFRDLQIEQTHEREPDPVEAGRCLASAARREFFELPLFNHEVRQWIARVNLVARNLPELEIPVFDDPTIEATLAQAFKGLSLAKEAQAVPLLDAFRNRVGRERWSWMDELAPVSIPWGDGGKPAKIQYADPNPANAGNAVQPEIQVKLTDCFPLKEHPAICEGRVPLRLWVCTPDGKRLDSTTDWPTFRQQVYPRHRAALAKKFPSNLWP